MLVIDDDALVRAGIQVVLEGLGYRVLAADGGEAALEILRGGADVNALVTDYAMPGMNGAVLVCEARRLVPGLAVLVVTGYASKPDGIGHVAVLLKPFKPDDLASRLFEILHSGRPENVVLFSANWKARGWLCCGMADTCAAIHPRHSLALLDSPIIFFNACRLQQSFQKSGGFGHRAGATDGL